jgi:hypothetical protein
MMQARGRGTIAGTLICSMLLCGTWTLRAVAADAGAPSTQPIKHAVKPLRVLFIGNSYTFFNGGLGTIVQQLALSAKHGRPLDFVEITKGGQTLEGHWKEGKALAAIRRGGWDVVVLQEHSLRPIEAREKMWQYARMFDQEIKKTGARTIFYETWARQNRPEMLGGVRAAYEGIARELKAAVAPAGVAWDAVLKANPTLGLHIRDLSHPSPAGSYLNACVFYQVLFEKSPEGLTRKIQTAAGKLLFELPESEALLLQRTAAQTCGAAIGPTVISSKPQ